MLFAFSFNEFVFWSAMFLFGFCWLIGTLVCKAGEAAGKVLKDENFQEGVKAGFWWWLLSDD